jgi:hypothetical protein
MTNVVRFPVERRARPTLDLLRAIAPDMREVLSMAETFDLDVPVPDQRGRVDADTAEYILNHFADASGTWQGALDEVLDPVVTRAVAACHAAYDVSVDAAAARQVLLDAQMAGHVWIAPLRQRAEALTRKTAALLIEAHARAEEAEGVARAVGLARRGEPWTPRDPMAEAEALFGMARRVG